MKHVALLGVVLALAMARPASATQSSGNPLGNILGSATSIGGNVLMGLVDCIELNGGVGPGFKLALEAVFTRIGVGYVRSMRAGLDGRQFGTWSERDAMMGLAPFSLLLAPCELMKGRGETWTGLANAFEMTTLGVERVERENLNTSTILYHKSIMIGGWHQRPGDRYSIGGEAHLLYVGGRLRFKPVQLAAVLLGIFGIDISARLASPDVTGSYPGPITR